MRTKGHTAPAMHAYTRHAIFLVYMDGFYWAGTDAFAATDTQLVLFFDAATLALHAGPCGTYRGANSRFAGVAQTGFEAGAQSPGRAYTDTGSAPGQFVMHQARAGQ